MSERATMNGKPVFTIESRVLNLDSGFKTKLLCDGPTFTAGSACAYKCSYCYVPSVMRKSGHVPEGHKHEDVVIRRARPSETLRGQLTTAKGEPKFLDPDDRRVIYASPLVDVAANMELVRETIDCVKHLLQLTHWQIRLLSKSNLLPKIAEGLEGFCASEEARRRIIYGVSTGTLDDRVAGAIEEGTPKPSQRIKALHWLQDRGYRTFAMVCPSLPQTDYLNFAREMAEALRYGECEHVWAEVINRRDDSFPRTVAALRQAGMEAEADRVEQVACDRIAWENYARATFEAHRAFVFGRQLRFLQYVTAETEGYWQKPGVVTL